jgi:hypothetical protein
LFRECHFERGKNWFGLTVSLTDFLSEIHTQWVMSDEK